MRKGQATIWVLLLLTTVIFGGAALAVDLGRMYTIQTEIQTVAEASAMSAATRLIGTSNSTDFAQVGVIAPLDSTTGNDNRFNLHQNSIVGSSDLGVQMNADYFNLLSEAQSVSNGGQAGPLARYVRVDVTVESPYIFLQFLNPSISTKPLVHAGAIAGIGNPLCSVTASEALGVVALDTTDTKQYGFVVGSYYTLYLTPTQQTPGLPACPTARPPVQAGTIARTEYVILNHTPSGNAADIDGQLFELGASGTNAVGDSVAGTTGTISIGSVETPMAIQGTTCPTAVAAGRDFVCGLNTRFGIDPSTNNCVNITDATTLAPNYTSDLDQGPADGTLQDYPNDYMGNARRVITVAILDGASTMTVLNFRQFLIEGATAAQGLTVTGNLATRGSIRAQYIGTPVPVKLGTTAGSCGVTSGVGRLVLFQ